MPEPNINTPPDVSAWAAQRTEADTGTATAVETPPVPPEVEPAAPGTEAPPVTEPAAAPSPAEQVVQAMVKGGLTAADAQKLVDSIKTPQPIKDALEAVLDGKPYPVPRNLTFSLKSGGQVSQRTLEDLFKGGLREADYTRNMQQVAQQRRQLEQRIAQADAQLAAAQERANWIKEQEQQMLEAQKDPKAWEEYQEMMRLRASSPRIAKLFDDALASREIGAQNKVFEEQNTTRQVEYEADQARRWISEIGREFPSVDPERVRVIYGTALKAGDFPENTPDAVRTVYQWEAENVKKAASPLEQELTALKARLEELEAGKQVEAHNAKTERVLQRAKAPNTAPAGGGPAAPVRVQEKKPIPPVRQAIDKAISDWAAVRD